MPRMLRGFVDGFIYHVINRGNSKQQVFFTDQDYRAFLDLMMEAKSRHPLLILAFCLMPNHYHILLMPDKAEDLSKWMQWLMTSHVRRYHKFHNTSGHVWQGRFKSFIVQNDVHLLTVLRYIEGNPVRAGLVKSAQDWQWSSHLESSGAKARDIVAASPIELPPAWTEYVDTPLTDEECETVRQSVNRQAPFGRPDWVLKTCRELGLESTIKPKGRPVQKRKKGTGYFI